MATEPLVSVLIPAYNAEREIERALDSVREQTFPGYEVIVVDDGSSDTTADLVASYSGVKLLRQPNRGIGFSRQRLISEARGEWLAFLDSDDYWEPTKLEEQVRHIGAATVGLIHTQCTFFQDAGVLSRAIPSARWTPAPGACALDHLLPENRVYTCSVLVRKSAINEAGGFDTTISKAEDWLMWFKVARSWEFVQVDEPLAWIARRADSASKGDAAWYAAERFVLEHGVLANFDSDFSRFSADTGTRVRRMVNDKLAAIASLEAECLDRTGDRVLAASRHREAIRRKPTMKGAWLRYVKHLASH